MNGVSVRSADGRMAVRDVTFDGPSRRARRRGRRVRQRPARAARSRARPAAARSTARSTSTATRSGAARPDDRRRRRRRRRARGPGRRRRRPAACRCSSTSCSTATAAPRGPRRRLEGGPPQVTPTTPWPNGSTMAALDRRVDASRAATSSGSCSPGPSSSTTRRLLVVAYPSRGLDIASVRGHPGAAPRAPGRGRRRC